MSGLPAICTIATFSYLAYVRVLTQSFLEYHPDATVYLCLVDAPNESFTAEKEDFVVIPADSLGIDNWDSFSFKYDALELSTALKPYLIDYLFNTYGYEKLVYFDCDFVIYSPLHELENLLDHYGLILTPHLLEPVSIESNPSELDIALAGIYNVGFLGISRRTDWSRFISWWKNRLYDYCIFAPDKGLNCDQRWMDFAPAYFDNVHILRDTSYNVAYWNLSQRTLNGAIPQITVDRQPLKFIHFSGFMVDNPLIVSRHPNNFTPEQLSSQLRSLLLDYQQRLWQNGHNAFQNLPYGYATFDNGVPIRKAIRIGYRSITHSMERWPHPFMAGPNSFFDHLDPSLLEVPSNYPLDEFLTLHLKTEAGAWNKLESISFRNRMAIAMQLLLGTKRYECIRTVFRKIAMRS